MGIVNLPLMPGELIIGTDHGDTLDGSNGGDVIYGYQGDDNIHGNGGADLIYAGKGNDYVVGGAGDDTLQGGSGDDYINAGDDSTPSINMPPSSVHNFSYADNDLAFGGDGNDTLIGGGGSDTLNGDAGNDLIVGDYYSKDHIQDSLTSKLGGIVLLPPLTGGDDVLSGGEGRDTILGGDGNDTLYGNQDADSLDGGTGNDVLRGGQGNDTLIGGHDDGTFTITPIIHPVPPQLDQLQNIHSPYESPPIINLPTNTIDVHGGDSLYGGLGADTFVYNSGDGVDKIFDFSVAQGDHLTVGAGLTPTVLDLGDGNTTILFLDSSEGGISFTDGIPSHLHDSAIILEGVHYTYQDLFGHS